MQLTTSVLSTALLATTTLAQSYGGGISTMATPSSGGTPSSIMVQPGSSTGTSTSSGTKVHVINVSDKNGSLIYSPASTSIPVGEMVQWHFYPKNHSVVQAAFSNPCEPISNVMSNVSTFYSGYMPVKPTDSSMPALTMMVKSDKPFWYYCSQGKHCQAGMVGVINPPAPATGKTLEAFAQKAKTAPKSTVPSMNGTMSTNGTSTSSSVGSAGSTGASTAAGAAATSPSSFPGSSGNTLVSLGFTTFIGLAVACLL